MAEEAVRVEVNGCIGSGLCVAIAPDHFQFAGARAEAVTSVISGDDVELVQGAAGVCPAKAISLGAH